jgi:hypothetical protein
MVRQASIISVFIFSTILVASTLSKAEEKSAKDWSGNDWIQHYSEDKTQNKLVAMMMALDVAFKFNKQANVCPPQESNGAQILAIVEKYMKDHPEVWHYRAQPLIAAALRESFPCPPNE